VIKTRENIFPRLDAEKTTERGVTVDEEAVTGKVQFIVSRDLAREVIKKLKLGERPKFDPVLCNARSWRSACCPAPRRRRNRMRLQRVRQPDRNEP